MLFCGGYGAGIIGERDGVSSDSLPHFLCDSGEVAARLGLPVECHLSNLDTSPFILTVLPLSSRRSSRKRMAEMLREVHNLAFLTLGST